MVQMLIKNTDSIQINESKVYHRIQKFVETGILDKVNVEGSKKVLYAKKNIPLNKS
jgi:Fe2+ or Zn2+ uptake regulation protein